MEFLQQAIDKLSVEANNVSGNKENAMKIEVKKALVDFSNQELEFAQAIAQTGKTFAECMSEVAKGVGTHISDLKAYERAVRFYFPGAGVRFKMEIDLCASVSAPVQAKENKPVEPTKADKPKCLSFNLDDLI